MRTEIVHLTDLSLNKTSFNLPDNTTANASRRAKMKKVLSNAIINELTEKQRICIIEYYLHGKKEKTIAAELGVSPSTVCRHIRYAKKKLERLAFYFEN